MTPDASNPAQSPARQAAVIPDNRRADFLPQLFGRQLLLTAEFTVYRFIAWLSPDYRGDYWDFCEYDGRPLYLRPTAIPRYKIICETNGYEGEVSADAAGIIVTLFAFSHLSFAYRSDVLSEGYARLYSYAVDHREAAEILRAID